MNTDLRASLADLRTSLRQLHHETEAVSARHLPNLSRLEQVILSLGQGEPKKPLLCPDEYLRQWREWLDGKRERLEWRVVRALCWEPEAATDMRFQNYLDRFWPDIYSRPLQGMIRACHLRWSPEFCQSEAAGRVRQRLESYRGVNGLLLRWQKESALLLGSKGAEQFSEEIIRHQASVEATCQDWKLDEQTSYVAMAAEEAVRRCLNTPSLSSHAYETLPVLLKWERWLERYKSIVSDAILHNLANVDGRYQQALVDALLGDSRLGDPRLQSVHERDQWMGIRKEARQRFIQWLSREDIIFFFEHVLPKGKDKHRRKDFWLPYVSSMIQSRPLLNNEDETRLSLEIRRNRRFGRIRGGRSAFLLDFGTIIAVEFQKDGRVYFYAASVFDSLVHKFWQGFSFDAANLKQESKALKCIRHIEGWQAKARNFLSLHGIRST
jgi:hypothetical protein